MSSADVVQTVGVLVLAFVFLVVVPLSLLFTFVKHRGGPVEMYRTAATIKAGKVTDLLPWDSSSLSELGRVWVGASIFTSSLFGRNDQAAGRVPSSRTGEGWVLAFCTDAQKTGTRGRVQAMTSAHRVDLRIDDGSCRVSLNDALLGSFKLGEPGLFGPDGAALGTYRRQVGAGQLTLRGREVASIDTRTSCVPARAAQTDVLITNLLAERTPEDEAWTLAVAVFQLAWHGVGVGA